MTRWTLPHDLSSARAARDLIRAGLPDPDVVDDAALIASELVANAVDHGGPPVSLTLTVSPEAVRLAVESTSAGDPEIRPMSADQPRGRGLGLVASLATDWGWARSGEHLTVWAVLSRS